MVRRKNKLSAKSNEKINPDNDQNLKYGGQWVLKKDNKIIFADKDFSIVMNKAMELQLDPDTSEIAFIDSGEAIFYATRI